MSNVVDFTARRLKTAQPLPEPTPTKTISELSLEAISFLLKDWEKMAKNNRLNDYFVNSVPHLSGSQTNYMSDLNAIAALELNLEIFPQIYFPGTIEKNQLGWVVHFFMGGERVSTPELMTEAYARCFNVLLFLKLKRDALAVGLLP